MTVPRALNRSVLLGVVLLLPSFNMTERELTSSAIYLDHNATTRPLAAVVEVVGETMREVWANPSSVHRAGQIARRKLELARESIARMLNAAKPAEIVFTSGGTESTNLAILGTLDRMKRLNERNPERARLVVITTTTEHSAVKEPIDFAEAEEGFTVARIPVDGEGVIDEGAYEAAVEEYAGRIALISVQAVNNETGVIQPIRALVEMAKARDGKAVFHTDGIQWVGKMGADVGGNLPVDLLSFAGHKFHGPTGIGGLYIKSGLRVQKRVFGGPHERERRGGTEHLAGVLGMEVALRNAIKRINVVEECQGMTESGPKWLFLRDEFEADILKTVENCSVNGVNARYGRLWNTSNIGFHGLEAEVILIGLSENGVYASAGAACSSGSLDPSPVLLAMGVGEERAHGSIRFSFSEETTLDEVMRACKIVRSVIFRLMRTG